MSHAMNIDPNQVKAIFLEAVEKHTSDGWDSFLRDSIHHRSKQCGSGIRPPLLRLDKAEWSTPVRTVRDGGEVGEMEDRFRLEQWHTMTSVPHHGTRQIDARTAAKALSNHDGGVPEKESEGQAFWRVDDLSGKSVRLTHVIGSGVQSIEPLDCDLMKQEVAWLRGTLLMWEPRCLPDERADSRTVDASFLTGIMLPSMIFTPRGRVLISRDRVAHRNVAGFQSFTFQGLTEPESLAFSPRGILRLSQHHERVSLAQLEWEAVACEYEELKRSERLPIFLPVRLMTAWNGRTAGTLFKRGGDAPDVTLDRECFRECAPRGGGCRTRQACCRSTTE